MGRKPEKSKEGLSEAWENKNAALGLLMLMLFLLPFLLPLFCPASDTRTGCVRATVPRQAAATSVHPVPVVTTRYRCTCRGTCHPEYTVQ
jgi:hypothetical protein